MILATKIKDVMTKNVVTVTITDSISEVEHIFRINHLRHAPVCENDEVVGMISLLDLRHSLPLEERVDYELIEGPDLIASQIMIADPITLQSNQTVEDAANVFSDNDFHAVPILEGDKLMGIISTTDIIRFLMESVNEFETKPA